MVTSLQLLLLLLLIFHSFSTSFSTTTTASASASPSISPSAHHQDLITTFTPTLFASVLSTLGFEELSSASIAANLSTATPLTIFAPSDSSLLTCPSCSLPLLLKEHSVPGLYPLRYLRNLAFGTKIETLAPNYCLTITASTSASQDQSKVVFVNGIEITKPDLFNNGVVIIHGLQGFVSHLSPLSCNVERMTSLSFPQTSTSKSSSILAQSSIMRFMLKDAIIRLRSSEYSILALALKAKYAELSEMKSATVFALDDVSIFAGGGPAYLSNFRFHVVPNRRLMAAELVSLPRATVLPTMQMGQNLVVTTSGGGGPLAPLKINYVSVTTLDLLHNSKIVVHAISTAFPHMHHQLDDEGIYRGATEEERRRCAPGWNAGGGGGVCEVEVLAYADHGTATVPAGSRTTVASEDHHGL